MKTCIFCEIINKKVPAKIVFEDKEFLAFLPLEQVVMGHTLVIPKTHFENIFDINKDIFERLAGMAKTLAENIVKENTASGINVLHASGKDAQQSVEHFHLHIIPRYQNDGLDLWFKNNL